MKCLAFYLEKNYFTKDTTCMHNAVNFSIKGHIESILKYIQLDWLIKTQAGSGFAMLIKWLKLRN
jgi:hypothetical protein